MLTLVHRWFDVHPLSAKLGLYLMTTRSKVNKHQAMGLVGQAGQQWVRRVRFAGRSRNVEPTQYSMVV